MSDSKTVPRELTAQMAIAAMRTLPVPSSKTAELTVREIWKAAYDAAPAAPPSDSKPRLDMCDLEDEAAHRAVPAAPGDARVSGTAAGYLPLHATDEKRLPIIDALAALWELVACKDLKDRAQTMNCMARGAPGAMRAMMLREYERRKPLAWAAARAVLAGTTTSARLFQGGAFRLHSGAMSSFKIDCDALSDRDVESLAELVAARVTFSAVEGVPRGGLRLAIALTRYASTGPLLIVDDVLTTGNSMEDQRAGREAIGVVIFARGPVPSWVRPLFVYHDSGVAKEVDAAPSTNHDAGADSCRSVVNHGLNPEQSMNPYGSLCADAGSSASPSNHDAGGARPLVLNSGEAMPQGQNAAETTPGALPASPLSAATSLANAGHVDGPSQEGAGDSAATPILGAACAKCDGAKPGPASPLPIIDTKDTDDLVARLRTIRQHTVMHYGEGENPDVKAGDIAEESINALIELRRERDDIFNAYEKFWLTDEGMLHAEMGSLSAHVQQAEARAEELRRARDAWEETAREIGVSRRKMLERVVAAEARASPLHDALRAQAIKITAVGPGDVWYECDLCGDYSWHNDEHERHADQCLAKPVEPWSNDPEYARNAIYRHVKSGREYAIICCGQMESDETQVVVYQGNDGQVWVRPRNEFAAKFEPVEP